MERIKSLVLALCVLAAASAPAAADPFVRKFPYQTQTSLAAGKYTFTFTLYDSATATVGLWTETKKITIPGSKILQHVLGSVNGAGLASLDLSEQLYLSVEKSLPLPRKILVNHAPLAAAPAAFWSDDAGDADTVDGTHASDLAAASHTHPGTDITSPVPFERLPAGTGADQVAVGNHGHAGALARITYGTVLAGATATIEIPHWLPFTLSLGSGRPGEGGVAFLQGMENDWTVGATYLKYNGDGTSGTGGTECSEIGSGTLLTFGSGNYVSTVSCPGETIGVHNLVLSAVNSWVELRWSLSY